MTILITYIIILYYIYDTHTLIRNWLLISICRVDYTWNGTVNLKRDPKETHREACAFSADQRTFRCDSRDLSYVIPFAWPERRGIAVGKKEVSTGRLVHYILAGLMHRPQSRRAHLRDRLPQALTHPVASHTCEGIHGRIYTNGETGIIHKRTHVGVGRSELDPARISRSSIADRTRWNLTRSAWARARSSQKPVCFQATPRKTSRRNESGIAERTRQWCSSMSSGMIPRSLRGDSGGYNMQSRRLYADLYW